MEIILWIVSFLMIVSVFLSLVKKDFWIYKILEYPRLQKLAIIIIVIAFWFIIWPSRPYSLAVFIGLILSAAYLVYKIWPYTIFYKKEMLLATSVDIEKSISIYSANVLQENTQYEKLMQQIRSTNPDLIFLLETNAAWEKGTAELKSDYPYTLLAPQENTYGLLFYSRFKLEDARVRYIVKNDLPSIEALLVLPSGDKVKLWGLHPEPPVPGESLTSTAKDKELMKVALAVQQCPIPSIVFGDLNDVAWSHTTELFRKTSKMLDPRRGRGFYNTFSAHHWFIRFPLDYIFCSKEFGLVSMKRLPKNGSDHYAMFTKICLVPGLEQKHSAPKANGEELQEAKDIASQSV